MYGKDNRTNSFLRIEQAIFYSFYLKINALFRYGLFVSDEGNMETSLEERMLFQGRLLAML